MAITTPASVHLYGRNFLPTREQVGQVWGAGCKFYPNDLSLDHMEGAMVHRVAIDGQNQHDFFGVVPRTQAAHPKARILDMLIPDDKTGRDMVALFVWGEEVKPVKK